MMAAHEGHGKVVQLLLDRGADTEAKNNVSLTGNLFRNYNARLYIYITQRVYMIITVHWLTWI